MIHVPVGISILCIQTTEYVVPLNVLTYAQVHFHSCVNSVTHTTINGAKVTARPSNRPMHHTIQAIKHVHVNITILPGAHNCYRAPDITYISIIHVHVSI